jgi:hypothetical protein
MLGHAPTSADRLQLVVAVGRERDQPEPENVGDDHGQAGGDGKRDRDPDAATTAASRSSW